jgi:hypothetical protein
MNRLAAATLVLLAAVGQVGVATAQAPPPIVPPPPPMSAPPPSLPPVSAPGPAIPLDLQRPPWFVRPYNMPGMPFYRLPAPPPQRQGGLPAAVRLQLTQVPARAPPDLC